MWFPHVSLLTSHTSVRFSASLDHSLHFSLTALMLVCITVQHWLELSALTERHLSAEVLSISITPFYIVMKRREIRKVCANGVQNTENRSRIKTGGKKQVRNRGGKRNKQVRERLQRRGWGKERRGEGKIKRGREKTGREKVEEREMRPKMLGKAFLFWDKCTMFGAQHHTEQSPVCYSAAICFSFFSQTHFVLIYIILCTYFQTIYIL